MFLRLKTSFDIASDFRIIDPMFTWINGHPLNWVGVQDGGVRPKT